MQPLDCTTLGRQASAYAIDLRGPDAAQRMLAELTTRVPIPPYVGLVWDGRLTLYLAELSASVYLPPVLAAAQLDGLAVAYRYISPQAITARLYPHPQVAGKLTDYLAAYPIGGSARRDLAELAIAAADVVAARPPRRRRTTKRAA